MSAIKSQLVTTRDIQKALEKYIAKNLIPPSEVDFTIKTLKVLLKHRHNEDYEHYDKKVLTRYLDRDKIINEHISFKELYTIEIFHNPKRELLLLYDIEYDTFSTHPKLILAPESKIPYSKYNASELYKILYMEINKIKAQNQILIRLFDEHLKAALKKLVTYIYAKKFLKKVKIPLFEGIEPILVRDSKLIFWFLEKNQKSNDAMVIEVQEKELLVEYIKPLYGRNGLNAFGEYLSNESATKVNDLQAEIDKESIEVLETQGYKKYIAKKEGFVFWDKKRLAVENQIRLKNLSRNSNILDSDKVRNNIEVLIQENDSTKDSVGEGVTLSSQNIHINGFVGANSFLDAVTLEIEGATHKDAKQHAKFAKINRHKGTLRCHKADITLLEGGVVHATTVHIQTALSGSVYAKDVTISHIKNNLKVYASNSITIQLVSGENNYFEINYKKVDVIMSKIAYINEEIKRLKEKKTKAEKIGLEDDVAQFQKQIKEKRKEIETIESSYKNATITITEPCRGINTILFTLDESHQILYKTQANQKYEPFHLEIKEDIAILLPPALSIELSQN
jgi:hypothetical protein